MSDNPKSERSSPAATPVWLQILRPILILVCCVLGFVAFELIVIRGTVFDGKTTPKWSEDGIDLSAAVHRSEVDIRCPRSEFCGQGL